MKMSDAQMEMDDFDEEMGDSHDLRVPEDPNFDFGRAGFNSGPETSESAEEPQVHNHPNLTVFPSVFTPEERATWNLDEVQTQNYQQEINSVTSWAQWNSAQLPENAASRTFVQNPQPVGPASPFGDPSNFDNFLTNYWMSWDQEVNCGAYYENRQRSAAQEQCIQTVARLLAQPLESRHAVAQDPRSDYQMNQQQNALQNSPFYSYSNPNYPSFSTSSTWNSAIQPVESVVPPSRPSTVQSFLSEPAVNDPIFEWDFRQKLKALTACVPRTQGREEYICDKCRIPGHNIQDCPKRKTEPTTPYRGNKISNGRFFCEKCGPYTAHVRPGETWPCPGCGIRHNYKKIHKIE